MTYKKPVLQLVSSTFILVFTLTTKCACPNGCDSRHNLITAPSMKEKPLVETIANTKHLDKCNRVIDRCSCETKNKSVINLWPLQRTDGKPRFEDIKAGDGYLYSYNPCSSFSEVKCNNVAMCKLSQDYKSYLEIGYTDYAYWGWNSTHNFIQYISEATGSPVRVYVTLQCDQSGKPASFVWNKDDHDYYFTLTTKCACPDGCPKNSERSSLKP